MNLQPVSKSKYKFNLKETLFMRFFGFTKIPMLFFIKPQILDCADGSCVVKIKLNRKTKNHLNSMYFGVLAAGADCAGGFIAMKEIYKSKRSISLSFKHFEADFLKRAEGDTYFTCHQTQEVKKFVQDVIESGERMNMPMEIVATCPDKLGDEPVAKFTLLLSLKLKS